MTMSAALQAELLELLEAVCRQDATRQQRTRLEHLVCGDADARAFYVDYLDLHAQLRWSLGERAPAAADQSRGIVCPAPPLDSPASSVPGFPFNLLYLTGDTPLASALLWLVMLFGAGLVIMVLAMLVVAIRGVHVTIDAGEVASAPAVKPAEPAAQKRAAPPVARLARLAGCQWLHAAAAPSMGDELAAGQQLALKSGLAEIIFQDGAKVLLQGPAEMEVASRGGAYLRHGSLTATVESPQAKGFEVNTPGMKYVDFGTEFGVLVQEGGPQEVHVFRGKVQAEQSGQLPVVGGQNTGIASATPATHHPPPATLLLAANEALRMAAPSAAPERIAAAPRQFVRYEQFTRIVAEQSSDYQRWQQFREQLRKRADVVAYYDFQADESNRAVLRNRALTGRPLDGHIEGAAWCEGNFPGKQALRFAGTNDRVRANIPGRFPALTAAVWINVESLPNPNNSILMSDRWRLQLGQCHWQFLPTKRVGLGPCPVVQPAAMPARHLSGLGGAFAAGDCGAWCHLAAVYDVQAQRTVYYRNGEACGSDEFTKPIPLVFGPSQIANWEPDAPDDGPVRNTVGRIAELLLVARALGPQEVRGLYDTRAAALAVIDAATEPPATPPGGKTRK
jgi:hypothetical protein